MTASLLKSPGLFSVFWLFSIMLSFGWSPLPVGRQLPSPPVPLLLLLLLLLLIYSFESFSNRLKLIVFHRSASDSKSHQVSRILLRILADLDIDLAYHNSSLSPPTPLPILYILYPVHRLQLLSPSPSCSIFFQFSPRDRETWVQSQMASYHRL